tara:strand:+ start:197 stop:580 length:384 start_codon:yes stop_codon:yes gene_type:complete
MSIAWSILPLFLIASLHWVRDRYLYNRTPKRLQDTTSTQWYTLLAYTPVWVFLQLVESVQILRNEVVLAFATTVALRVVSHYFTLGIVNDTFLQSRQQLIGLLFSVLVGVLWTSVRLITFSSGTLCA